MTFIFLLKLFVCLRFNSWTLNRLIRNNQYTIIQWSVPCGI